jgi:hypothetical protein
VIEHNRRDHESSCAVNGIAALFVGPAFVVFGLVVALDVIDLG